MNYKKIISIVLLISIIILSIGSSFAERSSVDIKKIRLEEAEMKYKEILSSRGFTNKYENLDLYNESEVKQWRLYYDQTSYLILDIFSGEVMEYGIDCEQPYTSIAKGKYYYGGPFCNYVKHEGMYYGIKDKKVI